MNFALAKLKSGKAAGHDGLVSEHITNCHPSIVRHLKLLFSMFVNHAYVPDVFGLAIIVPVPKDKRGDLSLVDNCHRAL